MRRSLVGLATLAVAAGSFGIAPAPASAHPVDELVQQIYITPTAGGIDLGVELEPGILVGPDFVAMLDTDDDGLISTAEAEANASAVQNSIVVTVDGRSASLTLSKSIYPDAEVLSAAGGSIALLFTVDAELTDETTDITVINGYTPLTSAGQPFTTTIQTNLTPAIDIPVTVATMHHGDLGRSLSATYTMSSTPSVTSASSATTAEPGPAHPRSIQVLVTLIVASAVLFLGAAIRWRRRAHRGRCIDEEAQTRVATEIGHAL